MGNKQEVPNRTVVAPEAFIRASFVGGRRTLVLLVVDNGFNMVGAGPQQHAIGIPRQGDSQSHDGLTHVSVAVSES